MNFTMIEGMRAVKFDLILTLALAALLLFAGIFIQRRVRLFARSSIPAAAVGGLLFALLVLALRAGGSLNVTLDTTLRAPLQNAFFTTIGLGATLSLLRAGGWRMGFFWLIATLTAVVQNVVGIVLALALGAPALLGIICGALTLTGGPSTGTAWAERLEGMGVAGAGSLIIASATFGIFTASFVGNPVATALVRRFKLAPVRRRDEDSEANEELRAISPTIDTSMEREAARATV
ncbi:MAG: sodium/glutamate symporter, partial [Pyrinomonadaceae bacterium]